MNACVPRVLMTAQMSAVVTEDSEGCRERWFDILRENGRIRLMLLLFKCP
jgi:hypothetical protein